MGDFNRDFDHRHLSPPTSPRRNSSPPRQHFFRGHNSSVRREDRPAGNYRGNFQGHNQSHWGEPLAGPYQGGPRYRGPSQQVNQRYHREGYEDQRETNSDWRQQQRRTDTSDRDYNQQPFRTGPSARSDAAPDFDQSRSYRPKSSYHQGRSLQRSSPGREYRDYQGRSYQIRRPRSADHIDDCQPLTAPDGTEAMGRKRSQGPTNKSEGPATRKAAGQGPDVPQDSQVYIMA